MVIGSLLRLSAPLLFLRKLFFLSCRKSALFFSAAFGLSALPSLHVSLPGGLEQFENLHLLPLSFGALFPISSRCCRSASVEVSPPPP